MIITNPSGSAIPFCIWLKTSLAIKDFTEASRPSEPRILYFYNKKQNCILQKNSTDFIGHWAQYDRRFRTNAEYLIGLKNYLTIDNLSKYSFIEVYNGSAFVCRHFIRFGELVAFMSDIEDRAMCPLIRKQLISDNPVLDWKRIISDSIFGRLSHQVMTDATQRPMNKEFYDKYKSHKP